MLTDAERSKKLLILAIAKAYIPQIKEDIQKGNITAEFGNSMIEDHKKTIEQIEKELKGD